MNEKSLLQRLGMFTIGLGLILSFIFVLLPFLTSSCAMLRGMSESLAENGIDPSRYYYTDVEQVKEAENYLRTIKK
jgi:hypothetical protein